MVTVKLRVAEEKACIHHHVFLLSMVLDSLDCIINTITLSAHLSTDNAYMSLFHVCNHCR